MIQKLVQTCVIIFNLKLIIFKKIIYFYVSEIVSNASCIYIGYKRKFPIERICYI